MSFGGRGFRSYQGRTNRLGQYSGSGKPETVDERGAYREINISNPIRALRSACSHASIESVSSGLGGIHCDGSIALVVARVEVGY